MNKPKYLNPIFRLIRLIELSVFLELMERSIELKEFADHINECFDAYLDCTAAVTECTAAVTKCTAAVTSDDNNFTEFHQFTELTEFPVDSNLVVCLEAFGAPFLD